MDLALLVNKVKESIGLPVTETDKLLPEAARLVKSLEEESGYKFGNPKAADTASGKAIFAGSPQLQIAVVIAGVADNGWKTRRFADELMRRDLPYADSDIVHLMTIYLSHPHPFNPGPILRVVERWHKKNPLTPEIETCLKRMQEAIGEQPRMDKERHLLATLLGQAVSVLPTEGEVWADSLLADFAALPADKQAAWKEIIAQAAAADGSKPSAKWEKTARAAITPIGEAALADGLSRYLRQVARPPERPLTAKDKDYMTGGLCYPTTPDGNTGIKISEKNISILKGLTWFLALCDTDAVERARTFAHIVEGANEKIPGLGGWASRVGNAAIWGLGELPGTAGMSGLTRLRGKIRDRSILKSIEAAIHQVATRAGMTTDELEDLAVPTGGLGDDSTRREYFRAEDDTTDGENVLLTLDSLTGHTTVQYFGAEGKERKAPSAGAKRDFGAVAKAVKAAEAELKTALSTQAARFDRFLSDERVWPLALWQERYLSHPVLGNIARRLIWTITDGDAHHALLVEADNTLTTADGKTVKPTDAATVMLWHPITEPTPDTVLRWRDLLASRGTVQPFKQAHREVYLLTPAEEATGTYSNRFAGHILKQHQFNSLCALRGWRNSLRLMVDDSYPPATLAIPRYNLRAEFWIEGIGENYGTDTNDTGTYLRLTTDQVRFYAADAPPNYAHADGGGYSTGVWANRGAPRVAPLPLDQIPPLILSEVLRDVDLFVGVASIGNDPTWSDGGPDGRFRTYWEGYSFGELNESAQTRADVLTHLLPRLKIASRCRLDGRFLFVRGDLKTYKIHLGSGNILMEPNDQYLCIVQSRSTTETDDLFLPFDGDQRLSLILSKAFLLAADTKITDPTILAQINRKA